ncbi:CYTH and CHAD domain-containing protein [Corynebacterium aquilae]|uniref:CYTH and CHAD domain-containing protein n=1 Tax=Corynebacterium aquilae TaxID=203263 RepID=UPI0009514632|nr:CYTH and CHAD domain-containing protein [Corynebacterium aquilae]
MSPKDASSKKTTSSSLEIELKFAVDDAVEVPPLATIDGVARVSSSAVHELSAVYFDTPDLRLTRNKITLRRRTGGKDDGWHVKLPDRGFGRREIRAELGPYEFTPPGEILAVIRPFVRTFELDPIAQIDNERHEHVLADADGVDVAEFVDDHVTAYSLLPGGDISSWREWEIELVNDEQGQPRGGDRLLDSARKVFEQAGAAVSSSPSKLVLALGESVHNAPELERPATLPKSSPAAKVLKALAKNRDKIIAYDPRVRADEPDAVHQMRVATRELRSHMSTFSGILVGDDYVHTAKELKHLAAILGHARDAEVVAERFRQALAAEDRDVVDEQTAQGLIEGIERMYRQAHADVVEFLDSERYAELLNSLDHILAHPPLAEQQQSSQEETAVADTTQAGQEASAAANSGDNIAAGEDAERGEPSDSAGADPKPAPEAEQPAATDKGPRQARSAEDILFHHLTQAMRKVRKLHATAMRQWKDTSVPLEQREDNVHAVRKAVKKLRYSAEAAGEATDLKTGKLYRACSDAQDILGTFQDTVTARDALADVARRAHEQGEDTFLYGLLYQKERDAGIRALRDYPKAMDELIRVYDKLEAKRSKLARKRREALAAERKAQLKKEAKAQRKLEKARAKKEKKARGA